MIKLYVCEIIKEFDFLRIGDIKRFFKMDYDRIKKQYPHKIKFLRIEVLR